MSFLADDVGPNAPVETNALGAKQSRSPFALDVVPMALIEVGRVFYRGEAKYERGPQLVGAENWRGITSRMHVRHAVNHVFAWLAGDRSDHHLEHAAARLLMAIEKDHEPSRRRSDRKAERKARVYGWTTKVLGAQNGRPHARNQVHEGRVVRVWRRLVAGARAAGRKQRPHA